ncbi:MAG: SRPBCC family protein [Halolamina sp.]
MQTYSRRTRVAAPLSEVWSFHSRIEGLEALTPGFLDLRVEAIRGPDGEADPEVLVEGSEIDLSMKPVGVGPRQSWTSRIRERDSGEGRARFVDDMVGGPFAVWEHTHRFYGDGDETVVDDRVRYELPGGSLGQAVGPLAVVGFEPMFRYRHRQTKARLE